MVSRHRLRTYPISLWKMPRTWEPIQRLPPKQKTRGEERSRNLGCRGVHNNSKQKKTSEEDLKFGSKQKSADTEPLQNPTGRSDKRNSQHTGRYGGG